MEQLELLCFIQLHKGNTSQKLYNGKRISVKVLNLYACTLSLKFRILKYSRTEWMKSKMSVLPFRKETTKMEKNLALGEGK